MPATPNDVPQAAGAALAALERYHAHVRRLAMDWMDMERYRTVTAELEAVRRHCLQLPVVSGGWVTLLIAHAELAHALWDSSRSGSAVTRDDRQRLLGQVEQRIGALQSACMDLAGAGRH